MRSPSAAADVPFFDIYGEAPRAVDLRFVHVERMRDRVDVHHGQVRPHRHAHLHQISLWSHGSGRYRFEQDEVDLPAAALTLMPAGVVHGFEVEARTDAIVISLSDGFRADCLRDVAEPVAAVFRRPMLLALAAPVAERLARRFAEIEEEYRFPSLAQTDAIAAQVRLILIAAARLADAGDARARPASAALLARFLTLLDENFRRRWTVADYADALGATPYLLNAATRDGLGASVSQAMQARAVVEAQRLLLYTMLGMAEIAFTLGYDNPSHFSRMFRQATGLTPRAWRAARLAPG